MTRVSTTEFKKNFGALSDAAKHEPVFITDQQQDQLVLMSAEEYRRLSAQSDGISNSDKARITRGLERHRDTILELAKR